MNDINFLKSNGVDVDAGLDYLEDMETYDETMAEFVRLSSDKIAKLVTYKVSGDLENYGIIAHSVKSDARYLGFTRLAEMALAHETEGKNGNSEFIENNFNDFIAEINRMINVSKSYIGDGEVPASVVEINETQNKDAAILVVDDSEMIRNFICKSIDQTRYDIFIAEEGNKALEIIKNDNDNKIKAIFLDLNMPGVNGFDVLSYFDENKLFGTYPISIITGADDRESIDKAFTYPIIDMLVKPFTEADVKRILERTLSFK